MTLVELKKRIDKIYEQSLQSEYKPEDVFVGVEDDDGNCLDGLQNVLYEKDDDIIVLTR